MAAKTIGIIAIKGGVGKTTATANLGAVLASEFGKKVLLVDANFSAPNLALHFGLVDPAITIHHVLEGKVPATKAVHSHELGFDFIPGSLQAKKIVPSKLAKKLKEFKGLYDVILLDSSPSLDSELLATMMAADELLVITTPDYPTLSCTIRAVKVAKENDTPITGLVLNKTRGKKFELTIEDIEDLAKTPVLAVLPDDEKVLEAVSLSEPAALFAPSRDFAIEYKKLAAALIGEEYKDKRLWSRIKSLFSRNPDRTEVNRLLAYKE